MKKMDSESKILRNIAYTSLERREKLRGADDLTLSPFMQQDGDAFVAAIFTGGQPHRILDRLTLLNLKEEYQVLLEDDFLTPTQAYYMSKVPTEFQDTFWRMIRDGRVDTKTLRQEAH